MKYEKGSTGVLIERREKTLKAGKPKKSNEAEICFGLR